MRLSGHYSRTNNSDAAPATVSELDFCIEPLCKSMGRRGDLGNEKVTHRFIAAFLYCEITANNVPARKPGDRPEVVRMTLRRVMLGH